MCRKLLIVCLVLVLAACAPAASQAPTPVVPTETPVPAPTLRPFPIKISASVMVGDIEMSISCRGTGEPTIILENGLGNISWENKTVDEINKITRTCRYLRAGMNPGNELNGPRTTMDQVKELRSLLDQIAVPGPYILVGHSVAGLNMPLFANQYPKDVVGIVCVDCRPPLFGGLVLEKLSTDASFDPKDIKVYLDNYEYWLRDWKNTSENLDLVASEEQALKVTSLGDIPFIALVADGVWGSKDPIYALDPDLAKFISSNWLDQNQVLCDLSTDCRLEVVAGTDHESITKNEAVIKAIQEVYDAVKSGQ